MLVIKPKAVAVLASGIISGMLGHRAEGTKEKESPIMQTETRGFI